MYTSLYFVDLVKEKKAVMMRKLVFLVSACACNMPLMADVTILTGAANWDSPSSYRENRLPSAGENVIVPAEA